ncbi:hypothetical protein [Streptomyces sp. AC495_CC817]|uniref:hypothetical protein n=1 Tax=Streptomyces sp. AC495_CC817 TaxID=2823900 RepID=UPI001C2643F8|nr:hypothetical protein [Streptomyces sp. AC495_CC817]
MTDRNYPEVSDFIIVVRDERDVPHYPLHPTHLVAAKRYTASTKVRPDAPQRDPAVDSFCGYGYGDTVEEAAAEARTSLASSIAWAIEMGAYCAAREAAPIVAELDA